MEGFITINKEKINGKTYCVPEYDLAEYQHFFMPKLDVKGVQHVYFNPTDINQLYKEKNIDPDNLQCNLKYDHTKQANIKHQPKHKEENKHEESVEKSIEKIPELITVKSSRKRPILREKGFTHFIHIPLHQSCKQTYENFIKTSIDQNDLDSLVDLKTLHATILVFRLNSEDELPKWQKILQSLKLKKTKITIRGVGIFPVKLNTNYTKVLYLKVDGLQQIIHNVVQKAISEGLITQKQLSNISFNKKTDMYMAGQQHLTLLKTKGEDIIDATAYLKQFAKINVPKVSFSDIRLSCIGSFDGESYYDEIVIPL